MLLRTAGFARSAGLRALAARVSLAAFAFVRALRLGLSLRGGPFGPFRPFLAFRFGLAAQALRRRAQAAADSLGLRLGRLVLRGLGVRIELAADQLDLRHLRA